MGAGRREWDFSGVFTTFWRRPIGLLDVILGSLAFYLVQLTSLEIGQVSYLLSSPWTRQNEEGFWNAPSPANWGKPARLTTHRLSLAREGWRKSDHHHACQFPTARSEDWAVPTKFWISAGKGSAPAPPCHAEMNCSAPRIMGPLSRQRRNKVQNLGAAWSFLHLAQGSLWKKWGKITDLLGLKKWPADVFFFLFFFFFIFPCPTLWLSEIL